MKTTIEIPDELLMRAKAAAAMRRTSLKAMIEHALKRELDFSGGLAEDEAIYEVNEHGFPVINSEHVKKSVTSEDVYKMAEDLGI